MVFACQKNSFQKTLTSTVRSCEKSTLNNEEYYEVICDDTILFPEGGGQPFDTGLLNDVPVVQVLRRGGEAVHFVKQPIEVGSTVLQVVDWERRLDHMQQHSGQHLISAIIDNEYQYDTTAWWLGTDVCHIELDTKSLSAEQIENIERIANEKIREQAPVTVKMCNVGDPELEKGKTRGLPDDVVGPLRIVEIAGVNDSNLCCGTHVSNLMQLQAIKLLYAEKGKKNKTNLFFIAGGRILKYLTKAVAREQKMTKVLNNEPDQHVDLVEKLQVNVKSLTKKLSNVLKRNSVEQAEKLLSLNPRPDYYVHYCKEAEPDYIETFIRTVKTDAEIGRTLLVLLVGEGAGVVTLYGSDQLVSTLGPKLADLLGGKGVAHGNKFQAKVSKLKSVDAIEKLLANENLKIIS